MAVVGCTTPQPADAPAPRAVEAAEVNRPIGDRTPDAPGADMCRAGEMQWLIGRPRTEIPVPVDVVSRRVTCTTCPVTQDYSPSRLNIFYNSQTSIVEVVRCG